MNNRVFSPYATRYQQPKRGAGREWLDFQALAEAAREDAEMLLRHYLPSGRREGDEYVALNPTRRDRNLGSFRINLGTGMWGDFAVGKHGGNLISLVAYISGTNPGEAAREIASLLGIRGSRHGR